MTLSNINEFSFCFLSFNVVLYLIFTLEPLLLRTAQNASLVGGRDDEKFHSQPIRSHCGAFTDQYEAGYAEHGCCRLFALHTVCKECVCKSPQYTIQSLLWKNLFFTCFLFLLHNV